MLAVYDYERNAFTKKQGVTTGVDCTIKNRKKFCK
jgi:hypothetical protein